MTEDRPAPLTRSDDALSEIATAQERLRAQGRALFGVTGSDRVEPLRAVLRRYHLSLYPVFALGLLGFVDSFQGVAVSILAPEISRTLGISPAGMTSLLIVTGVVAALASMWLAQIAGRYAIRALLSIGSAFVWTFATIFTGLVRSPAALGAVTALDGASSATVGTLHTPLLMDLYPPEVRVRVNGWRMTFLLATGAAVPLLVAGLVGVFDLTWRGVLTVLGVVSFVATLATIGLRDPGYGRWDSERVRALVDRAGADDAGTDVPAAAALPAEEATLGFFEASRRLWLIPTARKILVSSVLVALAATPVQVYFVYFLDERWGLSAAERGLFASAIALIPAALMPLAARLGDRLFASDPGRVIRVGVDVQIVAVLLGMLAVLMPAFGLLVLIYGLSQALPQMIAPAMSTTIMNVLPARMRAPFIALQTLVASAAGASLGTVLLAGLDKRVGLAWALALVQIPVIVALVYFRTAHRDINSDLDATVAAVIEQEELDVLARRGVRPPLLACRQISFSYEQVQVLFDVDLVVDEGEMVALLGTNGAGKSTLLGVVSGLNLPRAGSVRLAGTDITYLDPERRVRLGLSQVVGGDGVFGPLSVAENLRLFAGQHHRSRAGVDRAVDEAFDAFPALAGRRNHHARTLSGGEQQMLALSQALIARPRMLCIDELSLGLAPKVVGELLDTVRRINADGTAVILVEQSAAIALSLVERAYFMERGQIRFDGRAADLLGRDDLLRSIFLRGASSAAPGGVASR